MREDPAGPVLSKSKEAGYEAVCAIVRPEMLEPLKDVLMEAGVTGMTVSEVQGFGHQHGWKEYYRGTEVLLNMVPKVQVMLVVTDDEVDALVSKICGVAQTARWATARSSSIR